MAGWIAALALFYTTCLAVLVTVEVYRGDVVFEEYLVIAPGIRLGLLADGLSAPTLAVILLLCTALAVYSIRYVEHRIEILYPSESTHAQVGYHTLFFTLLGFFPLGFIGTILSTNLVAVYFFMEVLTITLFFLMAFFGYRERVRVAFVSLSWGIIGGAALPRGVTRRLQPDRQSRDRGPARDGRDAARHRRHRPLRDQPDDEAGGGAVPRVDAIRAR